MKVFRSFSFLNQTQIVSYIKNGYLVLPKLILQIEMVRLREERNLPYKTINVTELKSQTLYLSATPYSKIFPNYKLIDSRLPATVLYS